jgi:hypothetical protein
VDAIKLNRTELDATDWQEKFRRQEQSKYGQGLGELERTVTKINMKIKGKWKEKQIHKLVVKM